MTTKPNVAPNRATNYVVTAADWDNDVQQSQNYFLEVLAGTNSDKIPASALAANLSLSGQITVPSGVQFGSGAPAGPPEIHSDGTNVYVRANTAGMVYLQPNGNNAGLFTVAANGNVTVTGGISLGGGITSAFSLPSGQTVIQSGSTSRNGGATSGLAISYSAGSSNPYGLLQANINGTTVYIPYYT